ncbi:hypothetical protein PFISCL1PPCAC_21843, partial [Pristionchus fissidentatus]
SVGMISRVAKVASLDIMGITLTSGSTFLSEIIAAIFRIPDTQQLLAIDIRRLIFRHALDKLTLFPQQFDQPALDYSVFRDFIVKSTAIKVSLHRRFLSVTAEDLTDLHQIVRERRIVLRLSIGSLDDSVSNAFCQSTMGVEASVFKEGNGVVPKTTLHHRSDVFVNHQDPEYPLLHLREPRLLTSLFPLAHAAKEFALVFHKTANTQNIGKDKANVRLQSA